MHFHNTAPPVFSLSEKLASFEGYCEFKHKSDAFTSWTTVYARLHGCWLCLYKQKGDKERIGSICLNSKVKFIGKDDELYPRRFELASTGGLFKGIHWYFRIKTKANRDIMVDGILANIYYISTRKMSDVISSYDQMQTIVQELLQNVPLTNTRVKRSLTQPCFTGIDAVNFFIGRHYAVSREDAAALGQKLMDADLIHHPTFQIDFQDKAEPYRCTKQTTVQVYQTLSSKKYVEGKRFWKYVDTTVVA